MGEKEKKKRKKVKKKVSIKHTQNRQKYIK